MNSKNESLEELKNQEINYFKVIWGWKWAVILIPMIAMITAKLTEQPIPDMYETKASIVISAPSIRNTMSPKSFEPIAFLPVVLDKIIDQLALKMTDGTSMDQKNLRDQIQTKISDQYIFFIVRNESPKLAKKIADLWVQLVEKEAKKKERPFSPKEIAFISNYENKRLRVKETLLSQNISELVRTQLKIAEKKSELSTYQKRLKISSDYKVHIIPKHDTYIGISTYPNGQAPTAYSSFIILRDHLGLKNESPSLSVGTTLHPALESLILDRELEIGALDSKTQLLNTKIKDLEQELLESTYVVFYGELLKKFKMKFASSIDSINHAPVIKTPVAKEKNTHIFLAGIISFGFILLASVLKAHIDVMKQE